MKRVVLDTNIRVSSAVYQGLPRDVLVRCRPPAWIQLVSPPLLLELRRILSVRFLWSSPNVEAEIQESLAGSLEVLPDLRLNVCRDPDDNRILECALTGNADVIVTGDRDLLSIGVFRGIPILRVRQFLDSYTQP